MTTKITTALIAVILLLASALWVSNRMYKKEKAERIRTEGNQTALLTDIQHYKTSDSLNAVKIQTLELSEKELEQSNINYQETIDKLNIKNKRLLSLTQVETETKVEFKTKVVEKLVPIPGKDSLIKMDCLEYKDPYVDFSGCFDEQDSFRAEINIPIQLDIAGSYEPKKFWFIRYGFDHAEIDILSDNPYTEIKHARSVELKKKRRKRR